MQCLVLVWCYKATGDREQDLWRYWLTEHCIKQWNEKPTGDGCLSKKYELGKQRSSDIAVSCILARHSYVQFENRRFETLWLSSLTRITIDKADSFLLCLLLLSSVSILSGCPIINIRSFHQGMKLSWVRPMAYHPHNRVSLLHTSSLCVSRLWQL